MTQPIRLLAEGHPETGMEPSALVSSEDFTTPDTSETISNFFTSRDEKISAGVWECAPCREVFEAWPVDEMMTVISGSVTITTEAGAQTFTTGDTFVLPKGTTCTWEITETLRKFYMVVA